MKQKSDVSLFETICLFIAGIFFVFVGIRVAHTDNSPKNALEGVLPRHHAINIYIYPKLLKNDSIVLNSLIPIIKKNEGWSDSIYYDKYHNKTIGIRHLIIKW